MIIGKKIRGKTGILRSGMAVVSVCVLLGSCATNKDLYIKMDEAVGANSYEAAINEIINAQTPPPGKNKPKKPIYKENNQISMYLDKGFLEHYAGDYQASAADLRSAESAIADAYTKSVSQDVASYIANDNTKDYAGEDYEDVYVNIFNALNSYQIGDGNALAYINDLTAAGGELQVISRKYGEDVSKVKEGFTKTIETVRDVFTVDTVEWPELKPITFTNSALARYLGAVFSLNDGNKDTARYNMFELQNAYKTPVYSGIPVPAALKVEGERGDETGQLLDIPRGKGQLNVLAFAGLAPYKQETIDTVAFPFLVFLYPALLAYPQLASGKLKVPELVERPSRISGVSVAVSGGEKLNLELLEDLGAVLRDTFNGHQSSTYLKTYSRVVGKLAVAAVSGKAAEEAARQGGLPDILAIASGIVVLKTAQSALDASEAADVRSGRYLPGKAYIGAVNLDPGNYTITISYAGGKTITKSVDIKDGKISLVEAVCLQ